MAQVRVIFWIGGIAAFWFIAGLSAVYGGRKLYDYRHANPGYHRTGDRTATAIAAEYWHVD